MAKRSFVARGKWKDNRSINGIITDYKRFVGVVEADAMRIMETAAKMTLDATLPYVPLATGALRESGRAEAVKTSKGVAAQVSFGGPNAQVTPTKHAPYGVVDYAAVVNYDLTKQYAVGGPMFLEKGALESKSAVDAFIMTELRKIQP